MHCTLYYVQGIANYYVTRSTTSSEGGCNQLLPRMLKVIPIILLSL